MKRVPVNPADISGWIIEQLPRGILLNSAANGVLDTMTIGWGTIGVDWSRRVFTVYVRESRYTKSLLDAHPEFTLSIPTPQSDCRKILGYCGTTSGRDVDKFKDMNLTIVQGSQVSTPAVLELPLTIECKIIYKQDQDPKAIAPDILARYYPTGDFHTAYTGQIVDCYQLVEE